MERQHLLFAETVEPSGKPFKLQLLKWIGNKQRFAHEIISYFPVEYDGYHEPFIGSGAVLGSLCPQGLRLRRVQPLIEIWKTLKDCPETLKEWYSSRWHTVTNSAKWKPTRKSRQATVAALFQKAAPCNGQA